MRRRSNASTATDPPEVGLAPGPAPVVDEADGAAAYETWRSGMAAVESDNELFDRLIERSMADLRLLVNNGPRPDERYVAAGVPWFSTLFGRDSIITALKCSVPAADRAGDPVVLARLQATVVDDRRDASRARSSTSSGPGSWPRTARFPVTPTTERSTRRRSG